MKKSILLAAGLLTASASVYAQDVEPFVMPDMVITAISPNGQWAVSSDDLYYNLAIINLETGGTWLYGSFSDDDTYYSAGLGKCVSDNGIVIATGENSQPYYWENDEWHRLPTGPNDFAAYPNAITPDGSVIAGSVSHSAISLDAMDIMVVPVVWYRNEQGSYDMYQQLPHPAKDFTGRVPQYILVDNVSDDGTVLAADLTDYTGFVQQPLVFIKGADGNWTYQFPHPELINPEGVEFTDDPGEAPEAPDPTAFMTNAEKISYNTAMENYRNRIEPVIEDFMTPEEQAAYQAAYDAYMIDPENNPYPFISEYISADGMAAYNAAVDEYWSAPEPDPLDYMNQEEKALYATAYNQYYDAFMVWMAADDAFRDAFYNAISHPDALAFTMNSAIISPNGRYYAMSCEKQVEDPSSFFGYVTVSQPCVFDLKDGGYALVNKGQSDVAATMITDDAWVLGASPSTSYSRDAFIAQTEGGQFSTLADAEFVSLADVIKATNPSLSQWINDNMMHNVIIYDAIYNPETDEYDIIENVEEQCLFGTPTANGDLSLFASWVENSWDERPLSSFYSYVLPVGKSITSKDDVMVPISAISVCVDKTGVISINGAAKELKVYDLNGREVYSVNSPASRIVTPLAKGAYVVKVIGTDGSSAIAKAIF